MSFLINIFGKRDRPIQTYHDFWDWFQRNEASFFKVVKRGDDVERKFFRMLSQKLKELNDGFFYLTGMLDDNTVELVFTADGAIKNIAFIEEIVDAAPIIDGWVFTKLKPALDIKDVNIDMAGYKFNSGNIGNHLTALCMTDKRFIFCPINMEVLTAL